MQHYYGVLYDTGARVQELIDLSVRDVWGLMDQVLSVWQGKENEDRAYPAPDSRDFKMLYGKTRIESKESRSGFIL